MLLFGEVLKSKSSLGNAEINPPCPCGSGKDYVACCEPLHTGKTIAVTAEQLMRSRYSAYVTGNIDYLIETTDPSQRKHYSRKEIQRWAEESEWLKLEILAADETIVEFRAFYRDGKKMLQVHRERSTFRKEGGKWYYVEGE